MARGFIGVRLTSAEEGVAIASMSAIVCHRFCVRQ
jgi:hypothetical protein